MKLPDGYPRLGLVAGAVLWAVWAISCALGDGNLDRNGQVIGTDHTAFHTAAVLIGEGRGDALFDYPALPAFEARQDEITGKPGFLDPYRNPPFYALLYRPTAGLQYFPSFAVWAAIGLACFVAGLWLIHGGPSIRLISWGLCFYPAFATVSFGQNTFLSFAIFALVYRAVVADRWFLAGVAAGLLVYKPQLLFGLGVWWLVDIRRAWPAAIGGAVTATVLFGTSWLLLPAETTEWVRRLPDIAAYDRFEFYNLHTPRGFGDLLTGNRRVGDVCGFAGMALAAAWLACFRSRQRDDRRLLFAAAVFATLWGSPHTMVYEWALAIIPAVILWDVRPELREQWRLLFAIAWVVMFVSTPLTKAQLGLFGVAVQISVPGMAWVAWRADQLLAGPGDGPFRPEGPVLSAQAEGLGPGPH